jgi:NADPH-dependent glutamate synthase beta subunit-like oxidoreductase
MVKKKKKKKYGASRFGGGGAGGSGGGKSDLRPKFIEKTPPCTNKCPNQNNIREALRVVASAEKQGRSYEDSLAAAWYSFTETSPLPAVCGRVCPHPCETGCNRAEVDGAVGINAFERTVGDYGIANGLKLRKLTEETREEKVAVVGAGPAGLSCAYHLARRGYPVTLFEGFPKAGGMLRYGIPPYRLPREVIDAEVANIVDLGVELKTDTAIGKDISFDDLKNEYKAVFMGIGAHRGRKLRVEGEDAANVWTGADFLHQLNSGDVPDVGDKVIVIGGGDSAIDAARASKRLGADVRIIYRRTIEEMPAISHEVTAAQEEGIQIDFLAAPAGIELDDQGKAKAMTCIRMELGEPDDSGRRRPVPVDGSEFSVETTAIIAAISQEPIFDDLEMLREGRDWLKVDQNQKMLKFDDVYAGGDALDLATVIQAIAHGKEAAITIDANLNGNGRPRGPWADYGIIEHSKMKLSFYEKLERHEVPEMPLEERFTGDGLHKEVALGLSQDDGIAEAKRCMSCGHCMDCESCWMYCTPAAVIKPDKPGGEYAFKMELCDGCKKCAEECPCGYIEMF